MIKLIQTCGAYHEQYDAFIHDRKVGYLRLRHGHFTVHCSNTSSITVFEAYTKDGGLFKDDDERKMFLQKAKDTIQIWYNF
jgi:hypothetical protein